MSVPLRFSTTSNFFELANSFSSPPFIVNNVPENMLVLNIFFLGSVRFIYIFCTFVSCRASVSLLSTNPKSYGTDVLLAMFLTALSFLRTKLLIPKTLVSLIHSSFFELLV